MAIHYTCRCGANIRLPSNVAGRRARCNSCGFIFTVPGEQAKPPTQEVKPPDPMPPASSPPATSQQTEPAEPVANDDEEWYPSSGTRPKTIEFNDEAFEATWRSVQEFNEDEAAPPAENAEATTADKPAPVAQNSGATEAADATDDDGEWYPSSGKRPKLIDFADDDPEETARQPARRARTFGPSPAAFEPGGRDEERSGIHEAERSYWAELAGSFAFFTNGGSFVSFIIVVVINLWTVPLSYAGPLGLLGMIILSGYLCTFYLSVILETAAGEDELPNIWIDSVFDTVVLGIFRFVGSLIWVMLPAVFLIIIDYANGWPSLPPFSCIGYLRNGIPPPDHADIALILAAVGLLFWPIVVLGVSIGGSFFGLWPITIIRTAAAAPLAYLAMCCVLLVAAALTSIPYWDFFIKGVGKLAQQSNTNVYWLVVVFNSTLSTYAIILAMRAIGLYYRHNKRKFPWVAE